MGNVHGKQRRRGGHEAEGDGIRRKSNPRSASDLVIQAPMSFDSNFTLISPCSDLSDPSNFKWQNGLPPSNIPTPFLQRKASVIAHGKELFTVSENQLESNDDAPRFSTSSYKTKQEESRRVLNRKKKKLRRLKKSIKACFDATASKAKTAKVVSSRAFLGCMKQTNIRRSRESSYDKIEFNDDSNNPPKRFSSTAMYVTKEMFQQRKSEQIQLESDFENPLYKYNTYSSRWMEESRIGLFATNSQDQEESLDTETTPLALLDHAFAEVSSAHHEEDYLQRLASGPAPSPLVSGQIIPYGNRQLANLSPVALLFSEDGAASPSANNKSHRLSDYDVTKQKADPAESPFDEESVSSPSTRKMDAPTLKSPYESGSIFRPRSATKLKAPSREDASKSGGKSTPAEKNGPKIDIQGSAERLRRSRSEELARKSAGSIALGRADDGDSNVKALAKTRDPFFSPAANSITSIQRSPVPLLSNQCLSNAAFLFSPSYAGSGSEKTNKSKQVQTHPAFSISSFASRTRLSAESYRQQPILIPVGQSWERTLRSRESEDSSSSRGDAHSLDRSRRQVRFSDADRFLFNAAGDLMKVGATEQGEIDAKFSDLTEYSFFNKRMDPCRPMNGPSNEMQEQIGELTKKLSEEELKNAHDDFSVHSYETAETQPTVVRFISRSSSASSIMNESFHWEYREVEGKVCATPSRKKANGTRGLPASSPVLRFNAAKTRFSNPPANEVPSKKTPPKKLSARSPKNTLVASRINALNNRMSLRNSTEGMIERSSRSNTFSLQPIVKSFSHDEAQSRSMSSGLDRRTLVSQKSSADEIIFDVRCNNKAGNSESIRNANSFMSYYEDESNKDLIAKKGRLSDGSKSTIAGPPPVKPDKRCMLSYSGDSSVGSEEEEGDLFLHLLHSKTEDSEFDCSSSEEDPFADVLRCETFDEEDNSATSTVFVDRNNGVAVIHGSQEKENKPNNSFKQARKRGAFDAAAQSKPVALSEAGMNMQYT